MGKGFCGVEELLREADKDRILTYPEAAKELQVSTRTLEHRVKTGQIPYFRIGRSVRFSRNALLKHLYGQI